MKNKISRFLQLLFAFWVLFLVREIYSFEECSENQKVNVENNTCKDCGGDQIKNPYDLKECIDNPCLNDTGFITSSNVEKCEYGKILEISLTDCEQSRTLEDCNKLINSYILEYTQSNEKKNYDELNRLNEIFKEWNFTNAKNYSNYNDLLRIKNATEKNDKNNNYSHLFGFYSNKIDDEGNKTELKKYLTDSSLISYYSVAFKKGDKNQEISFNLKLATWTYQGEFKGLKDLSNQLNLCKHSYDKIHNFETFGASMKIQCNIDFKHFLNRINYETEFYELFMEDKNKNLIDIPAIITENENGLDERILDKNTIDTESFANWKAIHRRFYIVDNIKDYKDKYENYIKFEDCTNIRYAKKIIFHVHLKIYDNKLDYRKSKIDRPYLEILYADKARDDILVTSEKNKGGFDVTFESRYFMDQKNFGNVVKWCTIIVAILVVIAVAMRMYVWGKLNPSELSPDNYSLWWIFVCIMKAFKFTGLFFFFLLFGLGFYIYMFAKVQYNAFYAFPKNDKNDNFYKLFTLIWAVGFSCYQLYMFYRIYTQTNFDIFFIDWEHDKEVLNVDLANNKVGSTKYKGAWRGLHVANQFNLLQKESTINFDFCFLWLIFLLKYPGTNWFKYMMENPNKNNYEEDAPYNRVLTMFIISAIIFTSGFVQYAVRRIIQLNYPMKKTEFLDLCSVANISVFILDQSLHGYYLHGQNPMGKSDINMEDLANFLETEKKGKIRGRGLTDDQKDTLQTYEIYLSYNMRTIYDGLYYVQTNRMIEEGFQMDGLQNQSRLPVVFKYLPNSLTVGNAYILNNYMNTELKTKIEAVSSQSRLFIRDKTKLERFLEFPPNIDLVSNKAKEMMFYRDPGENFDEVLFTGMEIEWLIMIIYHFFAWFYALEGPSSKDPLWISLFMTFICHKIMFTCRMLFGEKNIARKAVVDNRFFS